ncbi:MAG TPA: hypothetical protein VFX51_29140 [Solirubrobacteraceae bacterium]|nr:hypothetical protein [Solirubrobacteraceae bacterium]
MSIELEVAALYLPARDAQLVFELFAVAAATSATHEPVARVVLDEAAWQLAVHGASPLVICGDGGWLMEHPFDPPVARWLLLPLACRGMVIACTT